MLAIGIEIGGTKLQVGVGRAGGGLQSLARHNVDAALGAEGIRQQLGPLVEKALQAAGVTWDEIARIGIGFGGPLDTKRGVTLRSFQIDGWDDFPLRAWAEEQWQRPVIVQNDASTAGLAEARYGAGHGCTRVFYVTIGSGIGGGWIVNGQIDEGQGLGAAEIGHLWVPSPDGSGPAELELVCSGWSIGRRAREAVAQQSANTTKLAEAPERIDAKMVYNAAEEGDALALRILEETYQTLGLAIGNVVTLLHPERVVIGGGVSQMGTLFWQGLHHAVQRWAFASFAQTVTILPAAFGEAVVVIGALALGESEM
jgi:glucokinase